MLKILNSTLNLLAILDPQLSYLILPLNNKELSINIIDIDLILTFKVKNSKIQVTNKVAKNIFKGKLNYILELIFNNNIQELIINEKLDYEGSLKDLNAFNKFLNSIDIKIIYRISELTSPEFAKIITTPFKKGSQFLKKSLQENIIDVKEFLIEEKKTLVSQKEINIFYKQIQELIESTNRIEAKLKLL